MSRSARSVLFLFLGVALPFMLSGQWIAMRASLHPNDGVWGIWLCIWFCVHVALVGVLAMGWPQFRRLGPQNSPKRGRMKAAVFVGALALAALYLASVAGLALAW